MHIGIPKEIKNHEYRVALTPEGARHPGPGRPYASASKPVRAQRPDLATTPIALPVRSSSPVLPKPMPPIWSSR